MRKDYISPNVKMLRMHTQPTMIVDSKKPEPDPEPEFDIDTNLEGLGGFSGGGRSVWAD